MRTHLLAAALLAGCAVGPDYQQPPVPEPAAFANADAAPYTAEPVRPGFWTAFDDALLAELVARARDSNHELRIALARLNEARALRRESVYDALPVYSAEAGYGETLQSADQRPGQPRETRESALYSGAFDAVWELDFFGRVRRGIEASRASEQALEAELRDVQVSVAAEIARTYFELRATQQRLAVATRNAENQRATLDYVEARLEAGRGTEFDQLRARSQLLTTRATIPQFESAIASAMHRLAVLVGEPPAALKDRLAPPRELPALPRLTAIGEPSDLLRRRPDVRAAERRLAALTARVGFATAELFPVVRFSGEIGFAVADTDDAGSAVGETWGFGPSISWAALDLGHVRARIDQAEARADGALAGYERTVLRALEETENALVAHARNRERLELLAGTVDATRRAAGFAELRYEGGASDFLDVLDAQRAQLEAEDRYVQARLETAAGLVALYKALGGGWGAPDAPTRTATR